LLLYTLPPPLPCTIYHGFRIEFRACQSIRSRVTHNASTF
jgi:hypothetical protein